jgi:hypothetical protein
LIPKDDLFRHKYDCGRLFTIMFTVIQKDLLYLVNQHILDKDGLACHTAITEHVHGTTNTDIRKAKYALVACIGRSPRTGLWTGTRNPPNTHPGSMYLFLPPDPDVDTTATSAHAL